MPNVTFRTRLMDRIESRSGSIRGLYPAIIGLLIVAAGTYVYFVAPEQLLYTVNVALYSSIGALGLNLLTGYAGQVSIGNAAFLAIGAYSVVIADGLPFPIPILVAVAASALVGFLIGLPSLRLRGLYLVFSTLALHYLIVFGLDTYDSKTKAVGGHFIEALQFGSFTLDSSREWFVVLLLIVTATAFFVSNIVGGRPGRAADALRHNEDAAAVVGINVSMEKLRVFTVSSAIIGLGGAVGAYFLQAVSIGYYSLALAVAYIGMILIGGLRSIWGAILGAFAVTMIPYFLSQFSTIGASGAGGFLSQNLASIQSVVYGAVIVLFLFFRPEGLASMFKLRRAVAESQDPA